MFNELSVEMVDSKQRAQKVLETFVHAAILASQFGFKELRMHESLSDLYQVYLFSEYRIDNWLSDATINSDLRLRFTEIVTSSPLISNTELSEREKYEWSIFEKVHKNSTCQVWGLGAAYIYDTLSTSLLTDDIWNYNTISITRNTIDKDGSDLVIKNANVRHFSTPDTFSSHIDGLQKERISSIQKSRELWSRRAEFFPSLVFGNEVELHLSKIGMTKKFLEIIDCLTKLNEFAKNWQNGGFDLNALKTITQLEISGESKSTMQKFSSLRKFQLDTGERVLFELHIKIPDIRIYFLPNEINNVITVGYIGKHLRIASEN